MKEQDVVARLTIVVEYDGYPDLEDIREIVEKCNELGAVKSAWVETLKLLKVSVM